MAVWSSSLCLDVSTKPAFSTSCQWWHWCSAGWTRWCQSQTTRTEPQMRLPQPEIPRLRPEGPGLQWGDGGRWMSTGVPQDPGLLSEDLLHQSLRPGMDHQWTSQQLSTQLRTSKISLSRMKKGPAGKCHQHSTNCFVKQWHLWKDLSSWTQPSHGEWPEHPSWT